MKDSAKRRNRRVRGSRFTEVASVAMVLLLLGIVALMGLAAREISRELTSRVGFTVVVDEGVSDARADSLAKAIAHEPYAAAVKLSTPKEVMDRWQEMMGTEEALDVNPFLPEIEVNVVESMAVGDSLDMIASRLKATGLCYDVKTHAEMTDGLNRALNAGIVILLTAAIVMLLISLALINNTVRLTIYARRFSIYAMRLIGATPGYIRRPFVLSALIHGLWAGAIAVVVICGLLYYMGCYMARLGQPIATLLPTGTTALTLAGVFLLGPTICCVTSLLATNKYIRKEYDDMYR